MSPAERENYLVFHRLAYKDDLTVAEFLALKSPRWSVIAGYYAMHDITKLFLADAFAVKITSPEIHEKAIIAIGEKVKDENTKEKLIALLKDAKGIYLNVERLKERILPELLRKGKQERGKSQYYTEDYSKAKEASSQKSLYFLDSFVKPYISIIEELMK